MQKSHYLYLAAYFVLVILVSPIGAEPNKHNIKVKPLSAIASYPERSAPATVMSLNETTISTELSARITELNVHVGDYVEPNQAIALLDCRDYQLARREAIARSKALDARITLAKKRLQRAQQLREKQTLAEEILDERESELSVNQADQAAIKANIEQARTRESRCKINSPFAGIVTERQASIGEYAVPGTALVTIIDTDNTEVSAQIYSADADTVAENTNLVFRVVNKDYPLKINHVLPIINSQTRNREIRLNFVADSAYVGTAGQLVWQDNRPHIPAPLLVRRNGQLGVFYVENTIARFMPIPDAQAGQTNPVSLSKESLIITEGQYSLEDGITVVIQ